MTTARDLKLQLLCAAPAHGAREGGGGMSAVVERVNVRRYCRCGAAMTARASGSDAARVAELDELWQRWHSGDGHAPRSQARQTPEERRATILKGLRGKMVLDALRVDGGWLTAQELALTMDKAWTTVHEVLQVLREVGMVEARQFIPAPGCGSGRPPWVYRAPRKHELAR